MGRLWVAITFMLLGDIYPASARQRFNLSWPIRMPYRVGGVISISHIWLPIDKVVGSCAFVTYKRQLSGR